MGVVLLWVFEGPLTVYMLIILHSVVCGENSLFPLKMNTYFSVCENNVMEKLANAEPARETSLTSSAS